MSCRGCPLCWLCGLSSAPLSAMASLGRPNGKRATASESASCQSALRFKSKRRAADRPGRRDAQRDAWWKRGRMAVRRASAQLKERMSGQSGGGLPASGVRVEPCGCVCSQPAVCALQRSLCPCGEGCARVCCGVQWYGGAARILRRLSMHCRRREATQSRQAAAVGRERGRAPRSAAGAVVHARQPVCARRCCAPCAVQRRSPQQRWEARRRIRSGEDRRAQYGGSARSRFQIQSSACCHFSTPAAHFGELSAAVPVGALERCR